MISPEGELIILHADGAKTWLPGPTLPEPMREGIEAAISPDGSRVAYTAPTEDGGSSKLFVIDVDSGRATLLVEPSLLGRSTPTEAIHIVLVENEATSEGHVFGLAWSPTGDRIALGLRRLPAAGIYTFAPNGSGFTRLIRDAVVPSWSPDGSQIAYKSYVMHPCPEDPDSCWSEDISGGLGVADADGSHAHTFGVGGSGPWNPA